MRLYDDKRTTIRKYMYIVNPMYRLKAAETHIVKQLCF